MERQGSGCVDAHTAHPCFAVVGCRGDELDRKTRLQHSRWLYRSKMPDRPQFIAIKAGRLPEFPVHAAKISPEKIGSPLSPKPITIQMTPVKPMGTIQPRSEILASVAGGESDSGRPTMSSWRQFDPRDWARSQSAKHYFCSQGPARNPSQVYQRSVGVLAAIRDWDSSTFCAFSKSRRTSQASVIRRPVDIYTGPR
jgi:hypothetical protein